MAQGITAVINYVQDAPVDENTERMIEEMSRVKTGQVTYAVRDTIIDDKEIKMGNIMGIADQGIVAVGTDIMSTTMDMVDVMIDEDSEIVSVYYGSDVTQEDAENIVAAIEDKYPDVEVEMNMGGQPIYYYVISVE